MAAAAPVLIPKHYFFKLGLAWILMWIAPAVHVSDEALTGFLAVYNPTVLALRSQFGFWPMPTFEFREWLVGLVVGILLLALSSPWLSGTHAGFGNSSILWWSSAES